MKIRHYWSGLLVVFVLVSSGACRSEFEKARLSNDPEFILQEANKYYDNEDFLKAQQLYELVLNQLRGTQEAEDIFFKYAYTFYHLRQFTLAAHYFNNFSATFAYSKYKEEADFMSPFSNYRLSPIYRLDQQPTVDAIQGFQEFVNMHPTSRRVVECNELIEELRLKLEEKAFASGQLYYDIGRFDAAIRTFENMLTEFPETDRAELVRFRILESAFHYAENSIFDLREERYNDAITKYNDFIRKYPTSAFRPRADKILEDIRINVKSLYE